MPVEGWVKLDAGPSSCMRHHPRHTTRLTCLTLLASFSCLLAKLHCLLGVCVSRARARALDAQQLTCVQGRMDQK